MKQLVTISSGFYPGLNRSAREDIRYSAMETFSDFRVHRLFDLHCREPGNDESHFVERGGGVHEEFSVGRASGLRNQHMVVSLSDRRSCHIRRQKPFLALIPLPTGRA
jgi:hypothetical protein